MNVSRSRLGRVNTWLSTRAWVWIGGMTLAIVLLGFALVVLIGRVADNASKLSELKYRSCIEDAVLDFKIAEGDLVAALVDRDPVALAEKRPAFNKALDELRGTQAACRTKFPE